MIAPQLKRPSREEVARIIAGHVAYRSGRPGGSRGKFENLDLGGFVFSNLDLTDSDFTGARLDRANFDGTKLAGAAFFGADLRQTSLVGAILHRADLRGALVHGADLSGAVLTEADMREGVVARQERNGELVSVSHAALSVNAGEASFRGATMNNAKMGSVLAVAADFTNAIMRNVKLTRAHLKHAVLRGTDLSGSDLSGANFEGADMRDCILVGAKTTMMRTRGADMRGALTEPPPQDPAEALRIADMVRNHIRWRTSDGQVGTPAIFDGLDLRGCQDLSGKPLTALRAREAIFFGLALFRAELQGAVLTGADLRMTNMCDCDLRGANLVGAKLQGARLQNARFGDLILPGGRRFAADLSKTDLSGADLSGADLRGAKLEGAIFQGANLTGTRGVKAA
jgi:uncharacterized protein YjbI with pentapeptide repeats